MCVVTCPPPAARPLPLTIEVVVLDLHVDAVDAQHLGGRHQPVGFLHAQLGQAAHDGLALRESSRDREDRIFIDHRRRALRRHFDALERAGFDAQLRDFLAAIAVDRGCLDRSAHLLERGQQPGAQRIGHHRFEHDLGARHEQRRDQGKRRRRRIGRHQNGCRLKLRLTLQNDAAADIVGADVFDRNPGAEMLEHPLGVIARRLSLDHRGLAGRRQSGQQDSRLELGRRHRRLVFDRVELG